MEWIWIITAFITATFLYLPIIDKNKNSAKIQFVPALTLLFLKTSVDSRLFVILWRSQQSRKKVYTLLLAIVPALQAFVMLSMYNGELNMKAFISTSLCSWIPSLKMVILRDTRNSNPAVSFVLYAFLASHFVGALWYSLVVEKELRCTQKICLNYGIYATAPEHDLTSEEFGMFGRYLFSLWWGLRNLSSFGQGLDSPTELSQTAFATFCGILGVFLFGNLIWELASRTPQDATVNWSLNHNYQLNWNQYNLDIIVE